MHCKITLFPRLGRCDSGVDAKLLHRLISRNNLILKTHLTRKAAVMCVDAFLECVKIKIPGVRLGPQSIIMYRRFTFFKNCYIGTYFF